MADRKPLVLISGIKTALPSGDKIAASDINVNTDATLAGNSDTDIASQKAGKIYTDNQSFINALIFG